MLVSVARCDAAPCTCSAAVRRVVCPCGWGFSRLVLQVTNLLVPVCHSASHVVYGSSRVEPLFTQLGQAAGAAAVLAVRDQVPVQDVNVTQVQAVQRAYGVEPHFPVGRCLSEQFM